MKFLHTLLLVSLSTLLVHAQESKPLADLEQSIQSKLDSICQPTDFGGATIGIVYPDDKYSGFAIGFADVENKVRMKPEDRMLGGSTGKVFFSAAAMQLVESKKLNLDDKVEKYLGHYQWFDRIQNSAKLTVRNLMRHSSGISRYVYADNFLDDVSNDPDRIWQPEELLSYVFDEDALFEPGTNFQYSDTNYILLAMILEEVSQMTLYELVDQSIIEPYKLNRITPQISRDMDGLVQGYNGENDKFYPGKVLNNGIYKYNVQFEWAGGGYVMNPQDLARVGKLIYEGKVFDQELMTDFLDGVDAGELGGYWGLGVHIIDTPLGKAYGHSGYFPGYFTNMLYFVDYNICISFQSNCSDRNKNGLFTKVNKLLPDLVKLIDNYYN